MIKLLKSIIDIIPEAQRKALTSLIQVRKKTVSRREEAASANEIAQAFVKKINTGPVLNPIYFNQGDKLSSENHNQNFQSIFIDLSTLFDGTDYLNSLISKEKTALESEYLKSKAGVYKLLSDVKTYNLRKKYPEFNEIKFIDFNTSKNYSSLLPFATVSDNVRLLQLPTVVSTRPYLLNRGIRTTKVYTRTYSSGLKGTLSNNFPPENIVDNNLQTFWGQMVLANAPVSHKFPVSYKQDSIQVNGPVVEVYLEFSHVEEINTIRLLPFSNSKLKVLDIAYVSSEASDFYRTISDFTPEESLDWLEYNFNPVFCKKVRITLVQENYKLQSYFLPSSLIRNTDIFSKIFEERSNNIVSFAKANSLTSLTLTKLLSPFEEAKEDIAELLASQDIDFNKYGEIDLFENLIKEVESYFSSYESESMTQINKYEYIFGLKEVEVLNNVYSPYAHYASPAFEVGATVSEIAIEVEERHPTFETAWESGLQRTSTEWSVDFGDGRELPIHPRNLLAGNTIPTAKDERLLVQKETLSATTRLGSYYSSPIRVKQDGEILSPELYSSTRITGSIPSLEVSLSGSTYSPNSIYTIDYVVSPDSYLINTLNNFSSRTLSVPEEFTEVGPNNDISLSKFPFIDYTVINCPHFTKENLSVWNYSPPQENIFSGQVRLYPTVTDSAGNFLQTGNTSGFCISGQWGDRSGQSFIDFGSNPNISDVYFSTISGFDFGYYLKIMDFSKLSEVASFQTGFTGFYLNEAPSIPASVLLGWEANASGQVFVGNLSTSGASGYIEVDYVLGVGIESDSITYAIDQVKYEPLTVTIGGVTAKNITNYETLTHPAFSTANIKDNEYEFIQAGKNIYFNQKVEKPIDVSYSWLHDNIKVKSVLRSHEPITPKLTPKVNSITVLLNNFVI